MKRRLLWSQSALYLSAVMAAAFVGGQWFGVPSAKSTVTVPTPSSIRLASSSVPQQEHQMQDKMMKQDKMMRSADAMYTKDNMLKRPSNWREWIFVGTPVTPNDMNNGKAAFPEFHNVYIDPVSYRVLRKTGQFPDGTMIAKELVSVGSKNAVSGKGYFQGEFQGLEIAVKDRRRFANEPGGWVYFSFGHGKEYTDTAKAFPAAKCNSCHQKSAQTDYVFTQYYPVLRAAIKKSGKAEMKMMMKEKKMSEAEAMSAAKAMGGDMKKEGGIDEVLFNFLKDGKYKNYASDAKIHPSNTGAVHGDVKVFFSSALNKSVNDGKKTHPVRSFAVKELYKDGNLYGWAASFKVKEDPGDGSGWYFYENLDLKVNKPVAAGYAHSMCAGCHASGTDYISSEKLMK